MVKQEAFCCSPQTEQPLQSCSCLDKHVCSGVYLNDDSLQQARAPYHTQPRSADLGLGMQIRQEAALPEQGHPGLVTAAITLLQLHCQPGQRIQREDDEIKKIV